MSKIFFSAVFRPKCRNINRFRQQMRRSIDGKVFKAMLRGKGVYINWIQGGLREQELIQWRSRGDVLPHANVIKRHLIHGGQ